MMGLGVQAYGTWPSDLEFIAFTYPPPLLIIAGVITVGRRGRHGSYVTAAHG